MKRVLAVFAGVVMLVLFVAAEPASAPPPPPPPPAPPTLGIPHIVHESISIPMGSEFASHTTYCPTGEYATGGGGWTSVGWVIELTVPTGNATGNAIAWVVDVRHPGGPSTDTAVLAVRTVCAPVNQ